MKLKPRADMINQKEFTKWRKTGQAFEVRETLYDRPNRVTATVEGMKEDGLTVSKWGYFSDIVVGPFLAFGLDSENKEYLKTANDFHIKTSQDVSEYNLRSFIYELENKKLYIENNEKITEINEEESKEEEKTENEEETNSDEKGKSKEEAKDDENNKAEEGKVKEEEEENKKEKEENNKLTEDTKNTEASTSANTEDKKEDDQPKKERQLYPSILDHSKLFLLPCEPTYTFSRKLSRFKQKFDKIYISNAMVHRLKEYSTLLKPNGEMIVEMAKFMIELKDELLPEYDKKVMGMANEAGLVLKTGIKLPERKNTKNTVKKSEEAYKRSHLVFVFKA